MSTNLEVPSADPHRNMFLNMSEILLAEGRFQEIAIVNTHKAPELMSCFVRAYAWCVEHVTNLTAEAVKAENAADFRKAEIILEEVPRILKDKGITGKSNEDYRNAVIAMDSEYIELRDRFQRIEMYREMLKGKQGAIDRAYMAVRKVFGSSMDFGNRNLGSSHSESSYGYSDNIQGLGTPLNPSPDIQTAPLPLTAWRPLTVSSPTQPLSQTVSSSVRAGFGKAKD